MTRLVCRSSNVLLLFNDVLLGGYGSCSRVLVFSCSLAGSHNPLLMQQLRERLQGTHILSAV